MAESLPPIHHLHTLLNQGLQDRDIQQEQIELTFESLLSNEGGQKVGLRRLLLGDNPTHYDREIFIDTLKLTQRFLDLTQNPAEVTENRGRVAGMLVYLANRAAEFDGENYSAYITGLLAEVNPALLAQTRADLIAPMYGLAYSTQMINDSLLPIRLLGVMIQQELEGRPVNINVLDKYKSILERRNESITRRRLHGDQARQVFQ